MQITLEGKPLSKARHRMTTKGGYVRSFDPQTIQKNAIRLQMQVELSSQNLNERPLFARDAHIFVKMSFHTTPPKTWSQKQKKRAFLNLVQFSVKPDLDNFCKMYLDCGNGILWEDDAQIVSLRAYKSYSSTPKTVITIQEIRPMTLSTSAEKTLEVFDSEKLESLLEDFYLLAEAYQSQDEFSKILLDEIEPGIYEQKLEDTADMIRKIATKYQKDFKKII